MSSGRVPFRSHIGLLHFFLAHRDELVERIEGLLNAQRKPTEYLQDGALLARQFEDCFYTLAGVTDQQSRLRGQLQDAHWASGFRPRAIPGLHNGPADPAELMMRAFYLWGQTRWPGRNGRVRYAHTLFNLYVIRCLELLSLRLWDEGPDSAGDRLAQIQDVLDALWKINAADQPVLVRDARWLIQTAQSLATDDLGAYFEIEERIAEALSEDDRIEIHKAGVRMAAGHLRSQIRYHCVSKAVSLDDKSLVLRTRESNALDFALLIQELVPLLEAYERACTRDDRRKRLELADAICQGISPDPELFLNRVQLLGAYSMIEPLFITTDLHGRAAYTPMGRRHVQLLEEYEARIARAATPLYDDCPHFRPIVGAYSPYGVLYGFSADLVKHMVLKASRADAVSHFGLEDVFAAGDADTLAWVTGWRKLPHLTREMERQFEYPRQFAEDIFDRIEQALRKRVSGDEARTGRFVVVDTGIPDLQSRYTRSSDDQFLSDRREGRFVFSYETPDGWLAMTKTILTEVLGEGRDVTIAGLPPVVVAVLRLAVRHLS
jgi:hypothetical protein